nr:unnamed protein product [Digitaria exilis]
MCSNTPCSSLLTMMLPFPGVPKSNHIVTVIFIAVLNIVLLVIKISFPPSSLHQTRRPSTNLTSSPQGFKSDVTVIIIQLIVPPSPLRHAQITHAPASMHSTLCPSPSPATSPLHSVGMPKPKGFIIVILTVITLSSSSLRETRYPSATTPPSPRRPKSRVTIAIVQITVPPSPPLHA